MTLLTREQLEDRLSALHRASIELVSDLSLEIVLDRIVHLAHEQAGARYAALGVVDRGDNLEQFISVGMTEEEMGKIAHPPLGKGLIGALAKERRTIRVSDIGADPRSVGFPPNHVYMRSFLGVPILLGDRLLGQIYLTDKENHPEFTEEDEYVIETLAAYAAVAISNARLYEGMLARDEVLSRRNDDLALLNNMAATLTSSLDVEEILDQTLTQVMAHLGVDAGEIFLYEDGRKELSLALHRGDFPDAFLFRDNLHVGEGYLGKVAETGKPWVSTNLRQDLGFLRPAVLEAGFQTMACFPLSARGRVVGVMSVATRDERHLDDRELRLLTSIGTWAGITIENASLHRQARRLAVLEERERIGMDLHDGTIQSIYAVGLALDYARLAIDEDPDQSREKIEQAIEGLKKTTRDIRAYILDLAPREFKGENLRDGLQRLVDEYRINTLAEASVFGIKDDIPGLTISRSTALFHICQEAIANVAKHSNARHVDIRLWTAKERVLMEIVDNGVGFDLQKMSVTLGHGLSNMHIRARKVGGDVEITSAPGEGTTVLAWVPRRA